MSVVSCARYEPKPLVAKDVKAALAVPEDQGLRVATGQLRHPVLKPMPLDLSKPLSPDEVAVLAVIISPELRAERDRSAVAGAQLLQAGILPNPQLTAEVGFTVSSSPPDDHTAYNLGVNWDITSLISHDAKIRAASAEAKSVALDIAWKEWQTAEAAKLAAYDLLALQAQRESAEMAEKNLRDNFDTLRRAVERHYRPQTELPAAESAYRDAHSALLAIDRDIRRQKLALNRAMGLPAETKIALRSLDHLPSKLNLPADMGEELEARRLDLLALKKGYESQDATLRAAVLGQFPKINLGFASARDTSAVNTVGPSVGIDIPLFDRNQGQIAIEKATRQKLFDEYIERVFTARADIARALGDIDSSNRVIADADQAIVSLEKVVSTAEKTMREQNTDVLSYYSARTSLVQKRIEALKLRQELVQNWIALEIASGRYLPMEAK